MLSKPNPSNIHIWRRSVIWSLSGVIYLTALVMWRANLSSEVEWWWAVICFGIGSFVVIFQLHSMREDYRSGYATIEIILAAVVIGLAFSSGLALIGMKIQISPFVPLIGTAASAVYFGVRALDNFYQSELKKKSRLGRWMELWIVESKMPSSKVAYPWQIKKSISSVPPRTNESKTSRAVVG